MRPGFFVLLLTLGGVVLAGCQCGASRTDAVRPQIEVEPAALDFGSTAPGVPVERVVTLRSLSRATLTLTEVSLVGEAAAHFSASQLGLPQQVEGGGSLQVKVVYAPTGQGSHAARLSVLSDASNTPELLVPLAGTALAADLCAKVTCTQPPGTCFQAQGTCALGTCTYPPRAEGTPCDDGDVCTVADACVAGACRGTGNTCPTPAAVAQEAYLKASNAGALDEFGEGVALSADGTTLAVTALVEDSNASGVNGNQSDNSLSNSGAVYVFRRTGTAWVQEAYLKASNPGADDAFGSSLALSANGDTVAVGAPGEDSNAMGVNGNQANEATQDSGAAYVFRRTGGVWAQEAYLKASHPGVFNHFGASVGLSADGATLAAGAWDESSNATGIDGNQANTSATSSGAIYVFRRAGASWAQEAYVKASNAEAGDVFGRAISLSADGSTLAVGAPNEDGSATGVNGAQADNSANSSGAVYLFRRTGTAWAQEAYLKASNTGRDDDFGVSVSLSVDGSTLAVGALGEDSNATGVNGHQADNSIYDSGAVYLFRRVGVAWGQEAYLKASSSEDFDDFGFSVTLSGDGATLAVGARGENSNATGVNGDQLNFAAVDSGAAYLFRRVGGAWAQVAYVKASNTEAADAFGFGVALSSDGATLAIGAPAEDSSATGVNGSQADNAASASGAVYVFRL